MPDRRSRVGGRCQRPWVSGPASRRASLGVALAVAGALASGCAHSPPAPRGWLPEADATVTDAFGGWIAVEIGREKPPTRVSGELIAVGTDTVLVFAGDQLVGLPRAAITKATLAGYDIEAEVLAQWATLGSLSTLSHGVGFIISLPVWLIAGVTSTSSAARAPLLEYPKRSWAEIAAYARFPQGLPAGVDRSTLRRK